MIVAMRSRIRLLTFDFTGIVADPYGKVSRKALTRALAFNKVQPCPIRIRNTMGFDKQTQVRYYNREHDSYLTQSTRGNIVKTYHQIYSSLINEVRPVGNRPDWLQDLRENFHIGIYSSQNSENLERVFQKLFFPLNSNITLISTEDVVPIGEEIYPGENLKRRCILELMSASSVLNPKSVLNFGCTQHALDAGISSKVWNVSVPKFSPIVDGEPLLDTGLPDWANAYSDLIPGMNGFQSLHFPDEIEANIQMINFRLRGIDLSQQMRT